MVSINVGLRTPREKDKTRDEPLGASRKQDSWAGLLNVGRPRSWGVGGNTFHGRIQQKPTQGKGGSDQECELQCGWSSVKMTDRSLYPQYLC